MCCCGCLIMPFDSARTEPQAAERKPFILGGRHVLASMILFFAVVAGVNGLMMTLAIRTMPGLDARNGYDVSQLYNADIKAAAAQAERGWSIRANIGRKPEGVVVSADVLLANHAPMAGGTVSARLEHPATRQLDRVLILKETSAGHYEAMAVGLPAGAWTLVLRVEPGAGAAPGGTRPAFVSRNRVMVEG